MLRVVLSPIEEELPFLTGVQLSLLERPYLDFDIRWGWLVAACWQRRECGALLRGTCRRAGGQPSGLAALPSLSPSPTDISCCCPSRPPPQGAGWRRHVAASPGQLAALLCCGNTAGEVSRRPAVGRGREWPALLRASACCLPCHPAACIHAWLAHTTPPGPPPPCRRLVWPESLGWRWGPSWDRQRAAAEASGGRALFAGEQQRRRQLPPPLGVLLVEVVGAELEPRWVGGYCGRADVAGLGWTEPLPPCCLCTQAACPPAAGLPVARVCRRPCPRCPHRPPLPPPNPRAHRCRRSTFLGRLKPVSSRLSLLLPAGASAGHAGGGGEGGAHGGGGAAAARAVLQKGLTSVQGQSCKPRWQQTFAFVVSSRHQVCGAPGCGRLGGWGCC